MALLIQSFARLLLHCNAACYFAKHTYWISRLGEGDSPSRHDPGQRNPLMTSSRPLKTEGCLFDGVSLVIAYAE